MKLVIENKLKDNVYSVDLSITNVTPEITELFCDYGAKNVLINAVISRTTSTTDDSGVVNQVTTVLLNEPTRYKSLLNDFPINKKFPSSQYGEDAEFLAVEYGVLMETRIKAIIDGLRQKPDNFTSVKEILL